jgi:STE24 endopeptidase
MIPLVLATCLFFLGVALLCTIRADITYADQTFLPATTSDTTDLLSYFTEEEMTAWKRYRLRKVWLHVLGLGSVLVFYALLLLSGLNKSLKDLADRGAAWCYARPFLTRLGRMRQILARVADVPERLYGGRQWLGVLLYCMLFLFLLRLFFFPQAFYRTYWFELKQGLSNYSLALWFLDYAKSLCLGTVFFAMMVFGIYGLIARVGRRWWLLLWVGVSLAIFGYVWIVPYKARLYSNFRSLEQGELRERLDDLARQEGIQLEDILVVDASRRTKKVNAYFQGAGSTQRIVLFDTVLDTFTPREITMILAHELSHWQEPDERLSYLVFSLTVFGVLALAHLALERGTRIRRLHYRSAMDVAGLPVLFLTFFLLFQILRPINLTWKRAREVHADLRSLEMVCDPEAFVQTHVKLARLNRVDVNPHPILVALFASHPPFLKRIEAARRVDCPDESPSTDLDSPYSDGTSSKGGSTG